MNLNFKEFEEYIKWISEELIDSQFQDVWTNGQVIVFSFYKFKTLYMVVDSNLKNPGLFLTEELIQIRKTPKPLTLFLKAHMTGLSVRQIQSLRQYGRVCEIDLGPKEQISKIQLRFIPNAFNIILLTNDKSLNWNKPLEMKPVEDNHLPKSKDEEIFNVYEFAQKNYQIWKDKYFKKNQQTNTNLNEGEKQKIQKLVKNKNKNLVSMKEQIESQLSDNVENEYRALGDSIKWQNEALPQGLLRLMDQKKSKSENMEMAYQKAKDIKLKRQNIFERIQQVESEILVLEKKLNELDQQGQVNALGLSNEKDFNSEAVSQTKRIFQKNNIKTRKIRLSSGVEAFMGKSALDNFLLLKSSRAWDLWVHLKDYPSAHAIIFRTKNQKISDGEMIEIANWLVKESLSKKEVNIGGTYAVIVVECRFVKPVKGSKGRVTYQNEKQLNVSIKN